MMIVAKKVRRAKPATQARPTMNQMETLKIVKSQINCLDKLFF